MVRCLERSENWWSWTGGYLRIYNWHILVGKTLYFFCTPVERFRRQVDSLSVDFYFARETSALDFTFVDSSLFPSIIKQKSLLKLEGSHIWGTHLNKKTTFIVRSQHHSWGNFGESSCHYPRISSPRIQMSTSIKQEPLAVTPSEGSFAPPVDAYIVTDSGKPRLVFFPWLLPGVLG